MTGAEPVWIEERDVLTLHDRLLAFHGGAEGVRDEGLLQSALARAKQLAAYGESADFVDMATAYTAGIVKNHPFVDGNKRVAVTVTAAFLKVNRYQLEFDDLQAFSFLIGLYQCGRMRFVELEKWVRAHVTPIRLGS